MITVFTLVPILFIYIYTVKAIKELNALKNYRFEELREKENSLQVKKVAYQKLTSEDEIVEKAERKFGLKKMNYLDQININTIQIENISKMVNKKYE